MVYKSCEKGRRDSMIIYTSSKKRYFNPNGPCFIEYDNIWYRFGCYINLTKKSYLDSYLYEIKYNLYDNWCSNSTTSTQIQMVEVISPRF